MNDLNLSKKIPRVFIFNTKGGVGKTAIALNFAIAWGYGIVTNDQFTIIDTVLEDQPYLVLEKEEKLPTIPLDVPLIYDFGGFIDPRAIMITKNAWPLIIPILPYAENIQTTFDFIEELKWFHSSQKILVIVNQTTDREFNDIQAVFNAHCKNVKLFPLTKSKAMSWIVRDKKSIADLVSVGGLQAYNFQKINQQFNNIFKYLLESSNAN